MGVARLYAALATDPGDDRRWDAIETEYRRTVALLARVTGRERLLDGAPVLQRVGRAPQSLRRLAVGAPGPPAGPAARPAADRPGPGAGAPPRPAHGQRRRGRAPEHRLAVDHADHVGLLRPAVEPGGTWADIGAGEGAFTLALADLLGPGGRIVAVDRDAHALRTNEDRVRTAVPGHGPDDARRGPDRAAGPPRARRARRGQQPSLRPPASDRSRSSGPLPDTSGRAAGSSSSNTTPIAATRTCRSRSAPRRGERLAAEAGLVETAAIGRVPSRFLGAIYSAVSRRA